MMLSVLDTIFFVSSRRLSVLSVIGGSLGVAFLMSFYELAPGGVLSVANSQEIELHRQEITMIAKGETS